MVELIRVFEGLHPGMSKKTYRAIMLGYSSLNILTEQRKEF